MIRKYINGNYTVEIDDVTGTKTRYTGEAEFISEFPESIDCTITYECDGGCEFCYAGCTPAGLHANLNSDYINNVFLPSLQPHTEIALNGNDLSHPQLYQFLQKLKKHEVIANITVNQQHFLKNLDYLHRLYDNHLIHGIGVSLTEPNLVLVSELQKFPTAVLHVVAGILSREDIMKLNFHGLKILILGYKRKGRGKKYYVTNAEEIDDNMDMLRRALPELMNCRAFDVISFDNLALDQLNVRVMLDDEKWNEIYMGADGHFTFFVDLVNDTFARDSLTEKHYDIGSRSVSEMFKIVKNPELYTSERQGTEERDSGCPHKDVCEEMHSKNGSFGYVPCPGFDRCIEPSNSYYAGMEANEY